MDILLRKITTVESRNVYQDYELHGKSLKIGASPDCDIQLRGVNIFKVHALMSLDSSKININAKQGAKIYINGKSKGKSHLQVGDVISLEGHKIKVIDSPDGFDVAFEIYLDEALQKNNLEASFVTSVSQTALSKRFLTYTFSTIALIVFLFLPLFTYFERYFENQSGSEKASVEFDGSSGYDILWSSGDILSAHYLQVGDNCSACHVTAFKQVENKECLVCHNNVGAHLAENSATRYSFDPRQMVGGTDDDCQSCHKEHNEPETIVLDKDSLCVDCHEQEYLNGEHAISVVTGFTSEAHPEFELDYLSFNKNSNKWNVKNVSVAEQEPENSNLKFSHKIHMDSSKVFAAESGVGLECSNCHVLTADQEHFEPITMEKDCRSCHDLKYDVSDPILELPHGSPELIIKTLQGHFIKKTSEPKTKTNKTDRRRRPGRTQRETECELSAYECGMSRATSESEIQFTQRGCITCHVVIEKEESDIFSRYSVLPVKINLDWYKSSDFDHKSHLTQIGKQGSASCLSCHSADTSQESHDVLIPGRDNCLSCHDSDRRKEQVELPCIACHQYHHEGIPYGRFTGKTENKGENQ